MRMISGVMGPFEAERHCLSPPWEHGLEGETIPQIASNENLRQNRILCYMNSCGVRQGVVFLIASGMTSRGFYGCRP